MFCYASRTGTKRNLAALKKYGWGLMVSRGGVWRTEGFTRVVGDNGAWRDFQEDKPFDEEEYIRFLDWVKYQPIAFEWLVLPDIVAGGLKSLKLSLKYLDLCASVAPLVLLPVQDGMRTTHIKPYVDHKVGVFLGGSTEWKLQTMCKWGQFCAENEIYYHVARVNSIRRMFLAIESGASSVDGSSASRYAKSLPKLARASKRGSLFNVRG